MPKRIPYSVANYEEIVNDDYYFVDKTSFIRNLEYWKIPLFLRPRRFGKSLWCSILECYYDINRQDLFHHLFGNTDIGRNPTKLHNSFTVMNFNFSKVNPSGTPEKICASFNAVCRETFKLFIYKYKLNIPFDTLPVNADEALDSIMSAITFSGLPPVYIIIDEYDNFTNQLLSEYRDDIYHTITTGDSFLRAFYKTIKAAAGAGKVGRCFITGVLPVTMDDMTSGFNITSSVTLEPALLDMVGFTKNEVEKLVSHIFTDYALDESLKPYVLEDLQSNYDGYRLLHNAANDLYNSTICNFYLSSLIVNRTIPEDKTDPNLQIDIGILKRMSALADSVMDTFSQLILNESIPVYRKLFKISFNSSMLLKQDFSPISLYYLGLVTWNNVDSMRIPNQNTQALVTEYFNQLSDYKMPNQAMFSALQQFKTDKKLDTLFKVFWENYVCLLPAQSFDKANENFFRSAFHMLCYYNLPQFMNARIENNTHSGRFDMLFTGAPHTPWQDFEMLIEFKHFTADKATQLKLDTATAPQDEDIRQINCYAADRELLHPGRKRELHIIYTVSGKYFRHFML